MPKVSVVILTKNRVELLHKALISVSKQTFKDFEVVVVSDGSINLAQEEMIIDEMGEHRLNINFIIHHSSLGITRSRQEALEQSSGELVAFLDDDDEWIDPDKLKKQVEWFSNHDQGVLCGGAMLTGNTPKFRPATHEQIKKIMLLRNNFFTSTVMFRRDKALAAGGFVADDIDLAEDYDLWLRMGRLGEMSNFHEVFTKYTQGSYNKDKFRKFLQKQRWLIARHKDYYPGFWPAYLILTFRIILGR